MELKGRLLKFQSKAETALNKFERQYQESLKGNNVDYQNALNNRVELLRITCELSDMMMDLIKEVEKLEDSGDKVYSKEDCKIEEPEEVLKRWRSGVK